MQPELRIIALFRREQLTVRAHVEVATPQTRISSPPPTLVAQLPPPVLSPRMKI